MQVLSTVPVMFSYWAKPADALDLSRRLNDHIAEVVRAHPTRFAGLGTIPLQDPDLAAGELERCVRDLGLRGAQIGTHVDANEHCHGADCRNLDHAIARRPSGARRNTRRRDLRSSVGHARQKRMPKYWLPWLVGMPAETSLAICCMMFSGVFDRFPKLRVAFRPRRRRFPVHHRPDRARLSRAAGSGRGR
jgi:aminocarboxymuconate-semialdehyde decarboxylase